MVLNRNKAGCKPSTGSLKKNFSKFFGDPEKISEFKEHKEGDSGLISFLSLSRKKLAEKKKVNKQLSLGLKQDDVQINALRDKVQVCKANSSKALEVKINSLKLPVRSKIKTEDELKKLTQGLSLQGSEQKKHN